MNMWQLKCIGSFVFGVICLAVSLIILAFIAKDMCECSYKRGYEEALEDARTGNLKCVRIETPSVITYAWKVEHE